VRLGRTRRPVPTRSRSRSVVWVRFLNLRQSPRTVLGATPAAIVSRRGSSSSCGIDVVIRTQLQVRVDDQRLGEQFVETFQDPRFVSEVRPVWESGSITGVDIEGTYYPVLPHELYTEVERVTCEPHSGWLDES
jgi:hypothetical protein